MPERLECELLQKARYINTLTFTFLTNELTAGSIKVQIAHATAPMDAQN